MPTGCRDRPLRQLHANGAVKTPVENNGSISVVLGQIRGAGEQLLAPLCLFFVGERCVCMNSSDVGYNAGGWSGWWGVGGVDVGAVGAVPCGVGIGDRRRIEAKKVP